MLFVQPQEATAAEKVQAHWNKLASMLANACNAKPDT